ncbi:hypothetical protein [Terrisporobacter petrolearius]|uniref:hypothetical protein n=1 Tax=Terrisporobacter petrolearius TaxID=1460447 RepID=UPI003B0028BF
MDIKLIDMNDVIKNIPNILQYFIPGFIFFNIRSLHLSKQIKNDKFVVLNSIVISFMLVEVLKLIPFLKNNNYFIVIVIGVILVFSKGYVYFKLEDKIVSRFTKGKVTNENLFSILVEREKGAWLRVYTKDVVYVGKIFYTEDTYIDGNRYIILSSYQTLNYEFEILEDNSDDSYSKVMLNMRDIDMVEKVKGK